MDDYLTIEDYEAMAANTRNPTLRCLVWARLAGLHGRAGGRKEAEAALGRAVSALDATGFPLARAWVGRTALAHGAERQPARARALVPDLAARPLPLPRGAASR